MTDSEFRALAERAYAVQSLREHAGWQVLAAVVEERAASKTKWLLNGNAKSLEEYRDAAGHIRGAQDVLALGDQLAEQVERERARREEAKAVSA